MNKLLLLIMLTTGINIIFADSQLTTNVYIDKNPSKYHLQASACDSNDGWHMGSWETSGTATAGPINTYATTLCPGVNFHLDIGTINLKDSCASGNYQLYSRGHRFYVANISNPDDGNSHIFSMIATIDSQGNVNLSGCNFNESA